jgi:ribosome-binding protein aMBF1 (putative translation factor)
VLSASFITPYEDLPDGAREIGAYVTELEKSHPERAALIAEARRKLADGESGTFRSLRLRRGLSQADLAKRIGTQQSNIARIEAGREDPTMARARKIADALGVTLDELDRHLKR